MKIILIHGIILTIFHVPTLLGPRGCELLEEKLNLSDSKKDELHLNQCGGIHGIDALSQISGGRERVRRYEITQVSSLLPSIKSQDNKMANQIIFKNHLKTYLTPLEVPKIRL